MKRISILAALLLLVAGLQTAWGQGFRVFKSDGTVAQFSLRTDSIVFYDGIGSDVDFRPFPPVNQCIAGTWYKSRNESVTFREDGTTDYMAGATYKFLPYQGTIVIFNTGGAPTNILKVHDVTAEHLIMSTLGSSTFDVLTRTKPVQLVTSITLSETPIWLQPDESKRLTATVMPADADNPAVTWTSSNEAVATVISNGLVVAVANGICTITCAATDGSGVKAECQVTVGAAGQTYTVNGVTFMMIAVEGGTFMMGSSDDDSDAYDREKPRHQVTLSSFGIGETEVTQELWEAVMGTNPSYFKGSKLPVEKVSWNDCQTFITKLNQLTGQTFRLPTEAEWEYAARGGTSTSLYNGENIIINGYNNSPNLDALAWYGGNCGQNYTTSAGCDVTNGYDISGWSEKQYNDIMGGTHPVGLKQPNAYGLYDMLGNVWEWCQDWYGDYSSGSQTNPTGPTTGSSRVRRGGSWYDNATYCRVAYRSGFNQKSESRYLGLRLAL